jgi:hypothetical protein
LIHEIQGHFNGPVAGWDWKEIKKSSGKLQYYIAGKLVVRKIGAIGILHGADILSREGVVLA